MPTYRNPFPSDPDRAAIWEMLVERDIRAFVAGDWSLVAGDFLGAEFVAVDAGRRPDPDAWRLGFPSLDDYRAAWLEQSAAQRDTAVDLETDLYALTTLRHIEIDRGRAIAHKKFDGPLRRRDGRVETLRWQSLYLCRDVAGRWRIQGFVGYLPNPMGD